MLWPGGVRRVPPNRDGRQRPERGGRL